MKQYEGRLEVEGEPSRKTPWMESCQYRTSLVDWNGDTHIVIGDAAVWSTTRVGAITVASVVDGIAILITGSTRGYWRVT